MLRLVDPDRIEEKSNHKLQRRVYVSQGPNYLWHTDGHDKLKQFGFAIDGCIDGYSKKIFWLRVSTTNNNPTVIAFFYLEAVQHYQTVPRLLRTGRRTENKKT